MEESVSVEQSLFNPLGHRTVIDVVRAHSYTKLGDLRATIGEPRRPTATVPDITGGWGHPPPHNESLSWECLWQHCCPHNNITVPGEQEELVGEFEKRRVFI